MTAHETRPPCRPLRVMFLITSMETGGAEILLVNLMRGMDPARMRPELACLKQPGVLGEILAHEFPVQSNLIRHKLDSRVLGRLTRLMKQRRIDALVTVGAGDKMFWGRLAARRAGVPVVVSALHSTGWPDGVGRLNRLLTPMTDAFVAVAEPHRQHLIRQERFPPHKVFLIPNGIDTERFQASPTARQPWRTRLEIPAAAPVIGIVAALRPEKNHELFLQVAGDIACRIPETRFLVVGDGPRRADLENLARRLPCAGRVHFAGNVDDIPGILSALDIFSLTSRNEASPVSILEAMSCGLPVVAPRVGSVDRAVLDGRTGILVEAGDRSGFVDAWLNLLQNPRRAHRLGQAGRDHVIGYGSLQGMTDGYMDLLETLHQFKNRQGSGHPGPELLEGRPLPGTASTGISAS